MTDKKNIYQRILAVTEKVRAFEKDGKNTQFNFRYAGIEQIVATIQPVCVENGICLIQEAETDNTVLEFQGSKGMNHISTCTVITHAINADNPEERITIRMPGYGYDSLDKGIFKAISGARKYAIFGMFNLMAGDDDPEHEAPVVRQTPAKKPSTGVPKVQPPPPRPPRKQASTGSALDAIRADLFPGLNTWPPLRIDKNGQMTVYPIKVPRAGTNPKMAWADEPLDDKGRGALMAACASKGYATDDDRHNLFRALYEAFSESGPVSTGSMLAGHANFLLSCLNHPNLAECNALGEDMNLEDESDFYTEGGES